MLCPPAMGAKLLDHEGDRWAVSMEELWRAAPALARRARRCRLAPFGGSPARRCLSEPLDGARLSQLVKEELSACRAADRHRYNFDFETLRPLEGRFLWQPVSPPPALVRTSSQQEETDSAGPESLLVRPAPELGRRAADATDRVVADGPQTKETSIAAPRYTDTTDILRIGKRPSAFSRCDGRRAKLAALCVDRDQPISASLGDHPDVSNETEQRTP